MAIELYKLVELHADLVDLISGAVEKSGPNYYIYDIPNGWDRLNQAGYFDYDSEDNEVADRTHFAPRYLGERSDVCMMFVMFVIQDLEDQLLLWCDELEIDSGIDWFARSAA